MSKKKKKRSLGDKIKRFFIKATIIFVLATVLVTLIFRFVPIPITPLMVIRHFEYKKADKDILIKKDWVKIEDISPNMPLAVFATEDQHFLLHHGFDFKSIKKAQEESKDGKRLRGASTISQQTAKNMFLWPGRSWVRKGLEVYFTVLIEVLWSKERIMEVYLNVIEMGEGIYGVEMAAQEYFNKSAKDLNRNQAALIAVCLPNPRKMKPNVLTAYRIKRMNFALKQMSYYPYLEY
jgi:monofunctional biosynthetic peptidoglycan transglycosylase